jgi:hypothetical protein
MSVGAPRLPMDRCRFLGLQEWLNATKRPAGNMAPHENELRLGHYPEFDRRSKTVMTGLSANASAVAAVAAATAPIIPSSLAGPDL